MFLKNWFLILLSVFAFIILGFLIFPLIGILTGNGFEKIYKAVSEAEVLYSVYLTMKISLYSTLFAFFTGLPLAFIIARYNFWGRSFIETMVDIPIMIPHTAAGIALLLAFGDGFLGQAFEKIGITFLDTETGIMIAMMFLSSTFLINGAKEGFKKVDVKLENVARTLGANSVNVFFKITIPNARKDIVNGCLMMWGRGLGEFGAVVILAYHPMIAPVLIYDRFTSYGLSYSAPVAAVMIIFSIVIFLIVRTLNNYIK